MTVQPTEVELQILNILWEQGPATVRQVHDHLQELKTTNYATTVKMLVVMFEKGIVTRDQSVRPQVYKAAVTQKSTRKKVVRSLVDRMFSGSTSKLVLEALSTKRNSPEELEEIRRLVEELQENERQSRKGSK
ncbi:MAG: BlaI/MecI/CopY family transcriptional regulator [Planctomycetota bacterium]